MRRDLLRSCVLAASFAAFAALASADTVTMRDGKTLSGTYLGGDARQIRLDMGDHIASLPVERVSSIQFDSGAPPASYQPAPAAAPPAAPQAYNESAPPPPPPSQGIVIPSGTQMVVRMIDGVDSDSSRLGATYRASLDEPVMVNGQTIIPRGADVTTKLVEDKQSGKISGRAELALVAQTVNVNGREVPITTGDVVRQSGSRGKRSAGVIGGGTALGAVLGGIAGGGRGAAIGAASGAAVGTGAEVFTHGQRVKIPSETRLTFTLSNDVNL